MKGSEDMFQKILSLILVVLICCSTSITVFAQTDHSHVEENHVSGSNEEPAITDTTSISSKIVPEESETLINPDYVVTAKVNPEYLERMFGAPDEILSGSTLELLEYFLESQFMRERIHSYGSSTLVEREFNFSCHEAFRELVSREDCIEVLESYAGNILYSSENDELDIAKLEKILSQPAVKSLISDLSSAATYSLFAEHIKN